MVLSLDCHLYMVIELTCFLFTGFLLTKFWAMFVLLLILSFWKVFCAFVIIRRWMDRVLLGLEEGLRDCLVLWLWLQHIMWGQVVGKVLKICWALPCLLFGKSTSGQTTDWEKQLLNSLHCKYFFFSSLHMRTVNPLPSLLALRRR